ncbi:MAG: general secretion pathway protein GspD [Rhodocyclaceae bacterium]|nr:general secretion pathway protein GspD [Rhodocyclaceae bacterium]
MLSYRRYWLTTAVVTLVLLSGCAAYQQHREGLEALDRGQFVTGLSALARASELEPNNVQYRRDWLIQRDAVSTKLIAQANEALDASRADDAESKYREVLSIDKDNARARAGLDNVAKLRRAMEDVIDAKKAMSAGDVAKAERIVTLAFERSPNHVATRALMREVEAIRFSESEQEATLGALYKKPINLEFRDATIKMVFDALARTTGINFVFDKDVRTDQKTTVFLKQTSLEDSIDVILATNQLDKKILNAGSVLIYPNTPTKVREYQDLVVRAFYLANAEAKNTATMLKTVLKLKDVYVEDRYNMLMLRESADTITLAEKLIALHDLEEPEVMLEVAVLEINRSNLLNLGVQITDQITVSPIGGSTSSNSGGSGTTTTFTINQLRRLNSDLLGVSAPTATINLQMRDGDAKLLANPSLRVRDREKARILIGDKVPVVTTTATPNGFLSESIQYLDVGLKLEAEPTIRVNNEIGIKLSLEVSSIVNQTRTNNGSQAYQIGTRNYNSVIRLRDGETQILAGLISDEDRTSANRIPLIGKLPVLGRLFSSQSDSRQKTEIVMSITPKLIRNMQRKDPKMETFWSGTDAALRTRPLRLRRVDTSPAGPTPAAMAASTERAPKPKPAVVDSGASAGGLRFSWEGPMEARARKDVPMSFNLIAADRLRALPLQISFNPSEVEIVSVSEGDFFGTGESATFGHVVDQPSGRISVAASTTSASGKNGEGKLLNLVVRLVGNAAEAEISLVGANIVAAGVTTERPTLPVSHTIKLVR